MGCCGKWAILLSLIPQTGRFQKCRDIRDFTEKFWEILANPSGSKNAPFG